MSRHLYPHVFGSGPTIVSPLSLRHYAKRMVLPCGFTTMGDDAAWTPAMQLESTDSLLWMRFWASDYSVSTGGARQFYSADKTWLQHTDNAFFSTGDIDFLWAGWVNHTTLSNFQNVINKAAATTEYDIEVSAAGTVYWGVGTKQASVASALTAGKWHFLVFYHDSTANTIGISIDNGSFTTLAMDAVVPADTTGKLLMGVYINESSQWLNGKLSRWCFLKNSAARAVIDSAATRTEMYNLGRGILSGNLDTLLATLGTFTAGTDWDAWNLNETSGTVDTRSFSGLNDLSPTFGELSTNGTFASDVSWTKGTGWTIAAGVASCDGTQIADSDLEQAVSVATGHRYSISFTVSGYSAGNVCAVVGGTEGTDRVANGTFTQTITVVSTNSKIAIRADLDFVGSIDNVTCVTLDISAVDGPSSDVASDSSGNAKHAQLTAFADSETAWSSAISSALNDGGRCVVFDGTDDYIACGSIGAVTAISMYVKLTVDNQEILTLTNSTTTAVTVAAGVLTFGASLTASAITVDGVSMSAADAGAALNDNAWHLLAFSLTSISATDCRLGTDGSGFGQIMLDEVKFNAGVLVYYDMDDGPQVSVADGDPIAIAQSLEGSRYQFLNATASERPECVKTGLNGKQGLRFDSIDDMLAYTGTILSGTSGSAFLVYTLEEVPNAYQTLLAQSDTATATKYVAFHARGNTANPHIGYEQVNADTVDLLDGNTEVTDNLDCAVYWDCDGTTHRAWLNGVAQTLNADTGANNGDLYDDTTGEDVVSIGGLKHTSETNHAGVVLYEVYNHPLKLTDASRAKIAAYVLREYGLTL